MLYFSIVELYKICIRAIFGHEFKCVHIDEKGKCKVFQCISFQDALEWAQAARGLYAVRIINRSGYLVQTVPMVRQESFIKHMTMHKN